MSNNLIQKMLKLGSVNGTSVLSESSFFSAKNFIHTNLPILNVAFSGDLDGGMLPGLTIFAGESKTFKSLLGLYCMKAYLEKYPDSIGILYDSEFGISEEYIKGFGIDPTRVLHIPVEHIEHLKFDFVKKLEGISKGDKVFFMVDSIGQIASKKETEDALDEKSVADMTRAKAIRSLLRLITIQLTMKDIPCIMINHVYQSIGGMFPTTVIPGGCVVAGTKIQMADGKLKDIEDIEVGEFVRTTSGQNQVTDIWCPDTLHDGSPECIKVTFEDGYSVIVSDSHKFLVSSADNFIWVEAKHLTEDMDIVQL